MYQEQNSYLFHPLNCVTILTAQKPYRTVQGTLFMTSVAVIKMLYSGDSLFFLEGGPLRGLLISLLTVHYAGLQLAGIEAYQSALLLYSLVEY
jgi:hypothetical protein